MEKRARLTWCARMKATNGLVLIAFIKVLTATFSSASDHLDSIALGGNLRVECG